MDADSPILRALAGIGRLAGLIGFVVVLVAAALGEDDPARNLAAVAVYVVFWVGLTFVSGLVGDVWRVLSPFDTSLWSGSGWRTATATWSKKTSRRGLQG